MVGAAAPVVLTVSLFYSTVFFFFLEDFRIYGYTSIVQAFTLISVAVLSWGLASDVAIADLLFTILLLSCRLALSWVRSAWFKSVWGAVEPKLLKSASDYSRQQATGVVVWSSTIMLNPLFVYFAVWAACDMLNEPMELLVTKSSLYWLWLLSTLRYSLKTFLCELSYAELPPSTDP